ncbi:MAG: EAL domain-containing protein [Sulfurisoma sp.]|nr:EAL domain-containing protein [Sulfurisoma sp.]
MRRQAATRLTAVMLLASVGIALIGYNAYLTLRRNDTAQKQALVRDHYTALLPRLEAQWREEAARMRNRIEFSRIVDAPDRLRWARFDAFLNAQRELISFSDLIVLDRDGQVLHRYGNEAHALHAIGDALATGWFQTDDRRHLFRVLSEPVWLGPDGQGRLVLLKSVDNDTLNRLAAPQTHLFLFHGGHAVASSRGTEDSAPPNPGADSVDLSGDATDIQTTLAWPGTTGGEPRLLVHSEQQGVYPMSQYLLRPVMAVGLVTTLIWFGLGYWLRRVVRRIEMLKAASDAYAATGTLPEAQRQLAAARGDKADEIDGLATSLEQMFHEVEMRHQEQRSHIDTLSLLDEAVLELDCDRGILRVSPGWHKLTRNTEGSGWRLDDFLHPEDVAALAVQCLALRHGEKDQVRLRVRLHPATSGQEIWVECRFVSHRDDKGAVAGLRGVLRDVTEAYLHEKQITQMALHDALTGLPNRVLLEDRIKIALRIATRTEHKVGVCFIDLDHFKNINDTLGHATGDRLLLAFAERVRTELRTGDTLARWGGDEFVLLLPDMEDTAGIREVIRKISLNMRAPLVVDNSELSVTFSLGAALYPDDGADVETLLAHADRAMFYAKTQGRNQICFFDEMTSQGIGKKELYIQARLVNAIKQEKIQAWFQPIIDAASGKCVAAEALARWEDDVHGWVVPATFIPMAENLGLIGELGRQVWLSSLAASHAWHARGRPIRLAVNISKRQLFMPRFVGQLLEELAAHDVAPDAMLLEITESISQGDAAHSVERLRELRQAGFRIAIDDFGTGYSSLAYLKKLPLHTLKIDKSFVMDMDKDENDAVIVRSTIDLAHNLGYQVVAEGIESRDTLELLQILRCNGGQGFHISRPLPANALASWLKKNGAGFIP